jgi:two-component system, OmpR family, alkaline phosphatase synthesis response regulator PhoP
MSTNKKKLLVADDEIHIVQVVAMKFRNNGFDVTTAENGAECLKLACSDKPDVIITDFQMPTMTGLEMICELRKHEDMVDVPVIMLTARGFAIDEEERQRLNVSKCISKPFSPKELLGEVEEVLSQNATV